MAGVPLFLWAQLRTRWRSWLSVALLTAAFGGVVMAAAAGAGRTDSAYLRFLAWSNAPDLLIAQYSRQLPPISRQALARLPGAEVAYVRSIGLVAPHDITLLAPEDGQIPGRLWKQKILAGRPADPGRPDEVDVSFLVAQARKLKPGDVLHVVLPSGSGRPVPVILRVVGIEAAAAEFPPQIDAGPPDVWATPAFWRAHRATPGTSAMAVLRLTRSHADVAAVQREVARLARARPGEATPVAAQSADTQRSIHQQAIALWLLAGLLAVLSVLILGQLLARLSFLEATDYPALRALGMGRRELAAIGVGRAAAIGMAGGALAVALAFALSPLLPVGLAGVAEPHPGPDADGLVLVIGGLATALLTVVCAAPAAWRATAPPAAAAAPVTGGRRRSAISLAGGARSAPRMVGVRLALQPGGGQTALPIRSTIAGAVVGVAGLSAATIFSASLAHLLATPRLYGVAWDAIVGTTSGAQLSPVRTMVARDPAVAAWSIGYSDAFLQVNGVRVDGIAMRAGRGPALMAVPVQGRLPRARGEIALGRQTLAAAHAHVGGTAEVGLLGGRPVRMRVVGAAIFPSLSDALGLGQGAALTLGSALQLPGVPAAPPPLDALLVRFHSRPGQPAGRRFASQVARAGPFVARGPPAPVDLVNFGQERDLPMLLGVALSGLALATVTHLLITAARRRRRDFAILCTLGCTRGQLRRMAAWQAGTLTGVALAIGVPAGALCGRVAWQIFARRLGILPVLVLPVWQYALISGVGVVLALAVAAWPGESAARTSTAAVLRSE
jgi:hypothetical protein